MAVVLLGHAAQAAVRRAEPLNEGIETFLSAGIDGGYREGLLTVRYQDDI
jgi:hypothetical protein